MKTQKETELFRFKSFEFNKGTRRWSFEPRGFGGMAVRAASGMIEVNGKVYGPAQADSARFIDGGEGGGGAGRGAGFTVELTFDKPGFRWRQDFRIAANGHVLTTDSEIVNLSAATLILGRWSLILADRKQGGRLELGAGHKDSTFFQQRFWNTKVMAMTAEKGEHLSQFIGHFYNPNCKAVFSANFITVDRIVSEHFVRYSPDRGVVKYDAYCALFNHELPAGGAIRSETLVVQMAKNPHAPLEQWAKALQRLYKPKLNPKTTVGWLGWSWVDCFNSRKETAEQVTLGNAAAIRKRLAGFEVDYIWTSQTNLKGMAPGNWLEFNREHFPHGYENTVARLRAMGFKPGLWVAPFWLFGQSTPLKDNLPNVVRKKDGTPYIVKEPWDFIRTKGGALKTNDYYFLDGSHPKSRAFIKKVFRAYHKMGIRYYMLDFLGCGVDRTNYDKSTTWTRADRDLMEEIRRAAGPDTHLLTAVGSTPCYTGCSDAARVNTDFGEGRPLYPYRCLCNATYIVHDQYFGNIRAFLQNAASTYFTHRKLYINDYNVMTVDKPVPRNIAEITATVFGLSGSPIMLGDDIRHIDNARLELIKKCLPRTNDTAFPVDLFTHVQPDDYARILALPVKTEWEDYLLLGVFNLDDESRRTPIAAEALGLNGRTAYRLYEFWNNEYQGQFTGRFVSDVPPNSCRLYRISRVRNHPWLLSSDMHVQQGRVEIQALRWHSKTLTLTGSVTRPRGEHGSLYFAMPNTYRLINSEDHWLMKDGHDNSVIIRKDFEFSKSAQPFELRFTPLALAPSGFFQ